jgi:hypothetical protein
LYDIRFLGFTRTTGNHKDEETYDDRGREGGTNFILRIKEQETCLTLQENDDDDDDDDKNNTED